MVVNRPSIYIYVNRPNQTVLREICSGIEEEGVFFEVFERDSSDLDELAFEAANDSMMGSGVGIVENSVAMQMKGLLKGKNVVSYHMPTYEECRKLGTNSARVIKKKEVLS